MRLLSLRLTHKITAIGVIGVVGVVLGIALATFLMALLAWPVRTQLGQSGLPS